MARRRGDRLACAGAGVKEKVGRSPFVDREISAKAEARTPMLTMTRRNQLDDDKKGAVPRAEKEHEKRGAMWILGSSIVGIIVLVILIGFLLKFFGHR
jgi:hypothetical protein